MSRNVEPCAQSIGRRALLRSASAGVLTLTVGGLAAEAAAADANALDPMADGFRRVVVGNTKAGKSVVMSDEKVKRNADIWRSSPAEPLGASGPNDLPSLLPASPPPRANEPTAGTRWFYAAIGPAKAPLDRASIKGWHRVSSISYVFITNGEVTLLLDEGQVVLRGGDLLVMRNAMHTWHNATAQPVGMLIAQYPLS